MTFFELVSGVDGGLGFPDGGGRPILGAIVTVGDIRLVQQTELRLRVRELVEADDAIDVIFRQPADCVLGEMLGFIAHFLIVPIRASGRLPGRDIFLNFHPSQPSVFLGVVRHELLLGKGFINNAVLAVLD